MTASKKQISGWLPPQPNLSSRRLSLITESGGFLVYEVVDKNVFAAYFINMLINQTIKYDDASDRLSHIFMALADPTRRAILDSLSNGEASVNDLAKPFPLSLPAVSRHLKVLERAGLISRGRSAQWRPCRIEAATLKEGVDWMNQYRALWEDNLAGLSDYLAQLQAKTKQEDA